MRPNRSPRPVVVPPEPKLTLDFVVSLHHRRARDATGLFLAEGTRFLSRALEHGAALAGLVFCPYRLCGAAKDLVTRCERAGVPLLRVSPQEYSRLSPGASIAGENIASGQGLLVLVRQAWEPLPPAVDSGDLWIGVESVRSPGNLGTLLRAGAAAGACGLIVFDRCEGGSESGADPYDPSAVRATMGSLFAHRLVRTTHRAFRRWARACGVGVVGASGDSVVDYRTVDYCRPMVVMLGDERSGLSDGQRKTCGEVARIPMVGSADSLNLAMAGTLMLYEAFRQRETG
ncbi:RNA methyltransferase [bacterium]|nr:MAG: RNA methyltransferase [bacterium]